MRIRKVTLTGLACTFGLLAFSAAPALAAESPEAPSEVTVEGHVPSPPSPSTEAVFHGILNPLKEGGPGSFETGEYEFLYKESATECKNGSKVPAASPAIALGGGMEAVTLTASGLLASTQYTVCLLARNGTKAEPASETVGPATTFTTATPAEKPKTEPVTVVTAEKATFAGTLNPTKEAETGWYFIYSTGAECTSGGTGSGETAHEAPAKVKALPVETEATGLEPNKAYKSCLVATNTAEESTVGNEVSLKTLPLPPTIEGLTASNVTPFAATLEAQVNPDNEPTECKFEYGLVKTAKLEKEAPCEQGSTPGTLEGNGNQTASANVKLAASKTYYYRLIVKSAAGKNEAEEKLTTLTAPQPTVDSESATGITSTEATLEAQVNPNYQDTHAYLQYSTTSAVDGNGSLTGATQTPTPPGTELGEGFGDQPVGPATLTGLTVGETYYYQAVATNATGTSYGKVQSFTTLSPPVVATGEALNVISAGAELSGTVYPGGLVTTYHFAYVEAANYDPGCGECELLPADAYSRGATTPAGSAGPDSITHSVFYPAGELKPETTYDYALVASNELGSEVIGANQTFTTAAVPPTPSVTNPSGTGEVAPAGRESNPAPGAVFPLLPYPSIAALDAKEAKEDKSIPGGRGLNPTTTLTNAEKLSKALKACKKKKKGSKRTSCERAAHKKFGPAKKAKKK